MGGSRNLALASRRKNSWDAGHGQRAQFTADYGQMQPHLPGRARDPLYVTNATVESTLAGVGGHTVVLRYQDGEQNIVIPADLSIVSYVPGEAADLKPGARVFVGAAVKQADGTL